MKQVLMSLSLFVILPLFPHLAEAQGNRSTDLKKIIVTEDVAKDAYIWGYPLVRFSRTKTLMTKTPGFGHATINNFFHADRLLTPSDSDIANPIPDTLYSSAFLDLSREPMVLITPRIKNRFYSLQFIDAFTNNIAFVSSRTRGDIAGKFLITGPQFIGAIPQGYEQIHSSTNFVWVVGHMQADPSSVKAASALVKKYQLLPYNVYIGSERKTKPAGFTAKAGSTADPAKIAASGVHFFDELGIALRENEPVNLDSALVQRFKSAGIGAGLRTSRVANTRDLRGAYERAVTSGEMAINDKLSSNMVLAKNGWNYLARENYFGDDYVLRAAMSKAYFGETNSAENIHPVTYVDKDGQRLNGNNTYVIRFTKDKMPPAKAFWSMTVYNSQRKSLVENSMRRYSLGSYSKNVIYNIDGSLDIYMSANEPQGHTNNWLPAPRGGFYVMLNLYNPTEQALKEPYAPPPIQKVLIAPIRTLGKKD
jgi:hypothetical protein